MSDQQREALARPFGPEMIRQKKGQGGRTWQRWGENEDAFIRACVPAVSPARIGFILDRSAKSVLHRVHGLGLRYLAHPARFWAQVNQDGACWLWEGAHNHGYGTYHLDGRSQGAHRVSYVIHHGPIPPGYDVHHLCGTTLCVRPDHLTALSRAAHLHAGDTVTARKAAQTQCIHGHPFDAENTYHWRGTRKCRACAKDRQQRRKAA